MYLFHVRTYNLRFQGFDSTFTGFAPVLTQFHFPGGYFRNKQSNLVNCLGSPEIAAGAGHHSLNQAPGNKNWYTVYHRSAKGDTNPHHREVCIEVMEFEESGRIKPVKITQHVPTR
jgi:hypothetical protein